MSTQTIPTAAALGALLAATHLGADDDDHIVRACDPDTALCGLPVPGFNWADDGNTCPACDAVDRAGDTLHLAGCATCRDAPDDWWLQQ